MHPFIKWTLVVLTPFALWIILSAVRSGHLRPLYEQHLRQTRRERIFLASLSFFLGFAAVRLLTHAIRDGLGPFTTSQCTAATFITWCGESCCFCWSATAGCSRWAPARAATPGWEDLTPSFTAWERRSPWTNTPCG